MVGGDTENHTVLNWVRMLKNNRAKCERTEGINYEPRMSAVTYHLGTALESLPRARAKWRSEGHCHSVPDLTDDFVITSLLKSRIYLP